MKEEGGGGAGTRTHGHVVRERRRASVQAASSFSRGSQVHSSELLPPLLSRFYETTSTQVEEKQA